MKEFLEPEVDFIMFSEDMVTTDTYDSTCDCVGQYSAVCDDCTIDQ